MNLTRRGFLTRAGAAGLALTGGASGLLTASAGSAFAQDMPTTSMMEQITRSFVTTNPAAFRHPVLASQGYGDDVDTRLLCVFDASGSVSDAEYAVQLRATASAIRSEDFRDAVFYSGRSIAIGFMDFGSTCNIALPWVDIREGEDAKFELLAQAVEDLRRRETGSTCQIKALFYANLCMTNCPWQGGRSIVDFMTDGKDNDSLSPREGLIRGAVRQLGLDHRATVNGLITVDPASADADLEAWTTANLITPDGIVSNSGQYVTPGFNQVVAFERSEETERAIVLYERTMQTAFKEKLIREVAGLLPNQYNIFREEGGAFNAPSVPANLVLPPRFR